MDYYIPYVKLFPDSLDLLELLGDAERGRLFTAVLIYAQTGEVGHLSGNERFIFPAFKGQIDRDVRNLRELSAAKSAAKAESGRKGAAARWGSADAGASASMANMASDGKNGTCHKKMANMANDGENGYKGKDKDKDEDKDKDKDKDSILVPDGTSVSADVSAPHPRETETESLPVKPKTKKTPRKKYGEHGWVRLSGAEYDRLLRDLGQAELDRCIQYVDESAQGNGNKNGWKDWNIIVRKCHRQGWGLTYSSQRPPKPRRPGLNPYHEPTPEERAAEQQELAESQRQMRKMMEVLGGGGAK